MINRIALVAAAAAVSIAALAGCSSGTPAASGSGASSGDSSAASTPAAAAELKVASTTVGSVVVNGKGMTVYVFDKDSAGKPSTCTGQCATLWPAVTTTAAKPAVDGVTGTVGTVDTADGTKQITLNGLPLYTFAKDSAAGDVSGQGVGGVWWTVGADGSKITATAGAKAGY